MFIYIGTAIFLFFTALVQSNSVFALSIDDFSRRDKEGFLFQRATLLDSRGVYSEANKLYKEVLHLNPNKALYLYYAAHNNYTLGHFDIALKQFKRLLLLTAEHKSDIYFKALLNLSSVHIVLNNHTKAIGLLERTIFEINEKRYISDKISYIQYTAHYLMGFIYDMQNDFLKANKYYLKFISELPKSEYKQMDVLLMRIDICDFYISSNKIDQANTFCASIENDIDEEIHVIDILITLLKKTSLLKIQQQRLDAAEYDVNRALFILDKHSNKVSQEHYAELYKIKSKISNMKILDNRKKYE